MTRGTALLSAALLASASMVWARSAPSIGDVREEQKDPEVVGKQPPKQPLLELTNFVADLITDQNTREEQVPGIDFFVINLAKELKERGSDLPRKDILDNSVEARTIMKDGHTDLRRGVEILLDARDIIMEVNDKLQPLVKENDENKQKVADAKDKLDPVVQEMREDKPESKGEVDTSSLQDVRDLKDDLEPLPEQLKKAAEKVGDAKNWLESAKGRIEQIELKRQKALQLDQAAIERLAQSRTRNQSLSIDNQITSEKVIRNEKEWFKGTVEKALKIQEMMEKLTAPDKGLGKAIEKTQGANQANQQAKNQTENSGKEIEQQGQKVEQQAEPHDIPKMHDEAVQKAKEAKGKAEEAFKKADDSVKAAEDPCKKSKDLAEKADKKIQDLVQKQLGERSKDELTPELADLSVDAPAPKQPPPPKGARAGAKKGSKPIPPNFRQGLESAGASEMMRQYGEGDYGRTR